MPSIHNAKLLLPNRIIHQGWISFENETISATGVGTPPRIDESFDAQGLHLAPGFIDLHVHGGAGADFLDATTEAFATISRFHAAGGTTALAPTGATSTYQQFEALLAIAGKAVTAGRLLPVHLEGPHLAETKAGAQNKALFTYPQRPQIDWLVSRASQIGTVTVAPELPGALEFIRAGANAGILMSAGHSEAMDEDMNAGVASGIRKVTHLYNAMSSAKKIGLFREAGLLEFALATPDLYCEIVADGVHVSPTLLKLAYQAKGPERILLVTDAVAGAGLPPGSRFNIGNYVCKVANGYGVLEDESALAGSLAGMIDLVRIMTTLVQVPLYEAVRMASLTPAEALGWSDRLGSLETGKLADFVLFDDRFRVRRTMVGGNTIYENRDNECS